MVLSEVERLMMMFGSGASTCATTFQWTSAETTRSPQPPSRRGHRECRNWRPWAGLWGKRLRRLFAPPFEAGQFEERDFPCVL